MRLVKVGRTFEPVLDLDAVITTLILRDEICHALSRFAGTGNYFALVS
jgi:hypothetical protein